ncbi:tetratricopeptide repeat-containing sulfotransferase family protein [Alteromonas sp. H39]|uniref:tetratricopeptide repeat-containing sulfotransferase family protein n=1 Tax=Alteromonas sp. H39 TaxID=3389876 RepID=UPI0039E06359
MQNTQANPTATLQTVKQAISQGQLTTAQDKLDTLLADNTLVTGLKAECLYMRAVTHRLSKNYQAGLDDIASLIALRPDHGRAFQEQAYIYKAQGDDKAAASAFYQATRFNPALLASWQQLLLIYQQQGNQQAAVLAEQHIAFLQSLPKPILGAHDLMHDGQLAAADGVCRRYLQQHKHDAEAMVLLAEIDMKLKAYHEAEFLLESCVEIYPQHDRAAAAYLSLLARLGKYPQAEAFSRKRREQHPNDVAVMVAHASALVGIGRLDDAVKIYLELLEANSDRPAVWLALGHARKAKGDRDDAITAYETAIELMPEFGDAYWSLANTKTYKFSAGLIAQMEAQVDREELKLDDMVHICFALGKAHEDKKNIEKSFTYYKKGNALKHSTTQFDIARTEAAMNAQKEACPASLFASKSGCLDPAPIFIVGLPRAGSTLLEQILASHSQVDGTMELHDILTIASRISGQKTPYPFNLTSLSDDQCEQLGQLYIEQTRAYRQGAPYFIDKMPNNFIHIGLIKRILPNAKIIDARRHPFDCCFSGYKQLFGDGQEFSYGLEEIGRYYRAYVDLMDHWQSVLPGEVLAVQHEVLLEDLEGQVKRLLDFCGLPFEEACLAFHQTQRVIKTPSSEQVRQPIYKTGMGQWKPFESHLTPLFDALKQYP